MLQIKFFQINDNVYAKARHDGNVVDTNPFTNVAMQIADYLKTIMTWGYNRNEIEFVIDPTCNEYDAEEIKRAIDIYAE